MTYWGKGSELPEFDHDALLSSDEPLLDYLDTLHRTGAVLVHGMPNREGEVTRFANRIGIVREVAFGIIHDVRNDASGYNVAHTCGELKPHTDLASYSWPPSLQLLHYLVNTSEGGETVIVDGWAVVEELRTTAPEAFRLLCETPAPFKIFSDDRDTYAEEPMIQLRPDGRIGVFRFSNQTVQPLRLPPDRMIPFYDAYRKLGRLVASDRFRLTRKVQAGEMLCLYNHRVLHGRLAFDPTAGKRHLQDLYMEWDDVMSLRRVIRGHRPVSPWPVAAMPAA